MRPIHVAEDVVPIARFKGQAAHWLRHARETGHPVVITVNGTVAGVLLSAPEFDRLAYRERLLASVEAGIEDLDAGRSMNTVELRRRLSRQRAARHAR